MALGASLVLSFLSYVPESPAINQVGPVGFAAANLLIQCFGYAAYIFPALLILAGVVLFRDRDAGVSPVRLAGGFFLLVVVSISLGILRPQVRPEEAGGWVGGFLSTVLGDTFGEGGSLVTLGAASILVFMMVTGRTVSEVIEVSVAAITAAGALISQRARALKTTATERMRALMSSLSERRGLRAERRATQAPAVVVSATGDAPIIVPQEPASRLASGQGGRGKDGKNGRQPDPKKASQLEQEEFVFDMGPSNYRLPSPGLLGAHDEPSESADEKALIAQSKILEQKLATFGVNGRVTAVRSGPVITTYEFEPEPGVKVSRVVNLCDDLTMALRAHGVRIVAPIPGKNVVGIEVSNRRRSIVGLRDLVDADEFRSLRIPLALALGRDTNGVAAYADLARMPHLLMAGATGTGKSVALNALIVSLLYKATPHDLRFIMIDPKMLELSLYEGIPHLLVPVVTDVKKATAALANVMREMDRRFEMMKDKRVRSLDDYNRRLAEEMAELANEPQIEEAEEAEEIDEAQLDGGGEEGGEDELVNELSADKPAAAAVEPAIVHEHLPRIVVIVDELADLMMSVGRDIETSITRLAQKARAAGIHLIVATQRPSVDVITGLIKANFPSRISFQVTARPDSRTILDTVGAERLLGNGDMLYMAPGSSVLQRLHGGLTTDREIHAIVDALKQQGEPDYRMDMLEAPASDSEELGEEEFFDELYDRAVDLVTKQRQGSTSWLQRKLGIGYNRAARIMEHMEREGVVGPPDGARPRKVLAQAIEA